MEDIRTGTIVGARASWGSGLAHLIIKDDERGKVHIPADSGSLGRALGAAFKATEGMVISNNSIRGKRIEYEVDDLGLLVGFAPI